MADIFETIFTSGIISVIISYLIFQKGNQLKYITEERKEWRDKLRKIAGKLYGADTEKTMKLITELKVRINTYGYGKELVTEGFMIDAHIWNLINEMEQLDQEDIANDSVRLNYQMRIIDYISLLLKDDWERSKMEVNGFCKGFSLIAISVFSIASVVEILALYFFKCVQNIPQNILVMLLLFFNILVVLLVTYFVKRKQKRRRIKQYSECLESIINKPK